MSYIGQPINLIENDVLASNNTGLIHGINYASDDVYNMFSNGPIGEREQEGEKIIKKMC